MANVNIKGRLRINDLDIVDKFYPVNSIFISTASVSPASFIGGNWEILEGERTFWMTNVEGEGGKIVEAGLPNITGTFNNSGNPNGSHGASGAFLFLTLTQLQTGALQMTAELIILMRLVQVQSMESRQLFNRRQ